MADELYQNIKHLMEQIIKKMGQTISKLKTTNTKIKFDVINKDIYDDFLAKSHTLIYEVSSIKKSNRISKFNEFMGNKLSQISLYFLKQQSIVLYLYLTLFKKK